MRCVGKGGGGGGERGAEGDKPSIERRHCSEVSDSQSESEVESIAYACVCHK